MEPAGSVQPSRNVRASRIVAGMSRVLLALLIAISGCSKSGGDEAAKVTATPAAGDTAGKVLEVSGKVTVAGKPLKVGDLLKADDLVETGEDGKVVIELTHNLAHWELGGNKSQKVSESIAWKLPKMEGNANLVITDMSAAGRPAERAAANSGTSAAAPPTQAAPQAETSPQQDKEAPPPKTATPPALPPPPPPKPTTSKGSPAPDVANPLAAPSGGGPGGNKAADIKQGKAKLAAASDMVEGKEPALRACLPMGSKVTLHVAIDATGKATTTVDGTTDAKVIGCMKTVISGLALPAEKTTVSMTIEKSTH